MHANYPNVGSINGLVGCACSNNKEHAETVFLSVCPTDYTVDGTIPFVSKTKPRCRWFVKYHKVNNGPLPECAEELQQTLEKLMRFIPADCQILGKPYIGLYSLVIMYAVKCNCTERADYEDPTALLSPWPVKKEKTECEYEFVKFFNEMNLHNKD